LGGRGRAEVVRRCHQRRRGETTGGHRDATERRLEFNQGLISIGSGVNFDHFIEDTYMENYLVFRASTTQKVYRGMLRKYLRPSLGKYSLGEVPPLLLQRFFAGLYKQGVSYLVILKDAGCALSRSALRDQSVAHRREPAHSRRDAA
jgi:hypothetical protein